MEAVAQDHTAIDVAEQGGAAMKDFQRDMALLQNQIATQEKSQLQSQRQNGAKQFDPNQQLAAIGTSGRRPAHVTAVTHKDDFKTNAANMAEAGGWLAVNRLVPGAVPSELINSRLDGNLVAFNKLVEKASKMNPPITKVGGKDLNDFAANARNNRQTAMDCNALIKEGYTKLIIPNDRIFAQGPGKATNNIREVIRENANELRTGKVPTHAAMKVDVTAQQREQMKLDGGSVAPKSLDLSKAKQLNANTVDTRLQDAARQAKAADTLKNDPNNAAARATIENNRTATAPVATAATTTVQQTLVNDINDATKKKPDLVQPEKPVVAGTVTADPQKEAADKAEEDRKKEIAEENKKEAELLAQNAQQLVQRRGAHMTMIPIPAPKPPGMDPRMGAAQIEAQQYIPN